MINQMINKLFVVFFLFFISLHGVSSNELQQSIDETLLSVDENDTKKAVEKIASKLVNLSKAKKDDNQTLEIAELVAQKIVDENISDIKTDSKKSLSFLVNDIKNLNYQIKILQDRNASIDDLNSLKKDKIKLFEKIPSAITNQKISYEQLLNYIDIRKQIAYKLEKYPKKSKEYMVARMDYYNIEIGEIFYTALLKIEKMYINGSSKKDISNVIQKAILSLQTKDYVEIKEVYEKLDKDVLLDIGSNFQALRINQETYMEIFDYLLENISILESSFVFNFLNLKNTLNYINSKINLTPYGINSGKTIFIVVITLLFYSLRRVLAKILLFIFEKIFLKQKSGSEALRIQAVNTIKKPMGILLIAYAIDICIDMVYYPSPVPAIFYKIFSIAYIIFYAWLITGILDGYGMILFSKIAKKSNRKEVVNLIIKIAYIMIFIIAILLVLNSIGFDVSTIIASLGIGGLAIALATKDIIANFFASIMVIFDNSFSQGDSVVIGGNIEGTIVETGLRKTAIRTSDNSLLYVPNSKIIDSTIRNWNRRTVGRLVTMTLNISYETTLFDVEKCIKDIENLIVNHPQTSTNINDVVNDEYDFLKYRKNMISVDDLTGYKSGYYVWLDDLNDSGIVVKIEFFTIPINKNDYIKVKQDIILKILNIIETNGLKLTTKYVS